MSEREGEREREEREKEGERREAALVVGVAELCMQM